METISNLPLLYCLPFESILKLVRERSKILLVIVFDQNSKAVITRTLQHFEKDEKCIFWPINVNSTKAMSVLEKFGGEKKSQFMIFIPRSEDNFSCMERLYITGEENMAGILRTGLFMAKESLEIAVSRLQNTTGNALDIGHDTTASVECQTTLNTYKTVAIQTLEQTTTASVECQTTLKTHETVAVQTLEQTPENDKRTTESLHVEMEVVLRRNRLAKVPSEDMEGVTVTARGANGTILRNVTKGTRFQVMYDFIGSHQDQPLYLELVEVDGTIIGPEQLITRPLTVNIREKDLHAALLEADASSFEETIVSFNREGEVARSTSPGVSASSQFGCEALPQMPSQMINGCFYQIYEDDFEHF
eukprot:Seg520.2 transcript_id=Seg520.2/GoldUCD/mRNA.D3Y31 product="hypothetical protein" pseudo=true protein_id=Seg520.2/GoldUCD/D3Y31